MDQYTYLEGGISTASYAQNLEWCKGIAYFFASLGWGLLHLSMLLYAIY